MARRVTDLDDRDYQARTTLRAQLRELRQRQQLTHRQVGHRMGFTEGANVRRLERDGVDQSRTGTIIKWARALGADLVLEPAGFPHPVWPGYLAGADALMAAILPDLAGDQWRAARCAQTLTGIRVACHVSQQQLAARLNITEQAVSFFETVPGDTALVMLQRHARGIARCSHRSAAYLAVRLVVPAAPVTLEVPDA